MYKGNVAKLRMEKCLTIGGQMVDTQFICEVMDYREEEGSIFLALSNGTLTDLSLNAIYKCEVQTGEYTVWCTGLLVDRYCSRDGKIVKMKIQNGFYKINIK